MRSLRGLIRSLIQRIFNVVKTPSSFEEYANHFPRPILITPGASIPIDALLWSIARRCEIDRVVPAHDQSAWESLSEEERRRSIRWLSIHEDQVLDRILSENPFQTFSTLSIFHVRGPVRNPPSHRPGFFWHLGLLFFRRTLYVRCGSPLTIAPGTPRRRKRALKVDFYKNLKIVRGTPLQSLDTQSHIILAGQEFEREIRILAERSGETIVRMRAKARQSLYDIAANPRRPWYSVISFVARLISGRLFSAVMVRGLERLEPAVKEHPVVIVPMHRSHLDYILVGSELYRSGINPPLVAAGINLRFWPVGYLIRSVGGYFVKRNARDRMHALILRRYVAYLIKRGHLQEFFLEGGRSRSGKMMQPKLGLLGIILDAYLRGIRKEILFVPVSITYENLIEDEVFAKENTGLSKTKENLLSLVRAIDIFKKKYGEVILNFGNAIALSDFVASQSPAEPPNQSAPVKRVRPDSRTLSQNLGLELTRAIRDQINPSLTALAYTALMCAPAYGLPHEVLIRTIKNLASLVSILRELNPAIGEFTPALDRFLSGRENILFDLSRGGCVSISAVADTQVFYITGRRRFTGDYYKNSTIHLFLPCGVLALSQLMEGTVTSDVASQIHPVLEYDYILPSIEKFERDLSALSERLLQSGILENRDGKRVFASTEPGIFNPAVLSAPIQTLHWVYRFLHSTRHLIEDDDSERKNCLRLFAYGPFLESLQSEFRSAAYLGSYRRTEAATRIALVTALESLSQRQIISLQDTGGQRDKIALLQERHEEVLFLERAQRALLSWDEQVASQISCAPPGASKPDSLRIARIGS